MEQLKKSKNPTKPIPFKFNQARPSAKLRTYMDQQNQVINPTLTNPATANDQNVCTSPGGVDLIGTNTDFRLWPADARVHLFDPSTGDIVPPEPMEWKNFHPWSTNLPATDDCKAPWPQTDATHVSLNGAQVSQATPLPYRITELVMDYRVPGVSQKMAGRFWFMLSLSLSSGSAGS